MLCLSSHGVSYDWLGMPRAPCQSLPDDAMNERLKAIVDELKAKGVRMTPQRLGVVGYLLSTAGHPTAREVFSAVSSTLPTLSLATVYDILDVLVRQRVLHTVCPLCQERRYLVIDSAHLHMICVKCGRVDDFPAGVPPFFAEQLCASAEFAGYTIDSARTVVSGVCPDCRQQAAQALKPRIGVDNSLE